MGKQTFLFSSLSLPLLSRHTFHQCLASVDHIVVRSHVYLLSSTTLADFQPPSTTKCCGLLCMWPCWALTVDPHNPYRSIQYLLSGSPVKLSVLRKNIGCGHPNHSKHTTLPRNNCLNSCVSHVACVWRLVGGFPSVSPIEKICVKLDHFPTNVSMEVSN